MSKIAMSNGFVTLFIQQSRNMLDFLTRNEQAKRIIRLFRQYIKKAGKDRMLSVLNYAYTAGTIDDEDEFGGRLY